MALCRPCNAITLERLIPNLETSSSKNVFYEAKPSFTALKTSARACNLCALFLHALSQSPDYNLLSDIAGENDQSVVLIPGDPYYTNPRIAKRISWLAVYCGSRVSGALSIFADSGDPLCRTQDIVGRPVSEIADGLETLDYLKSQIEDCRRNHPECALRVCSDGASKQNEEVPLPTRLLDLDGAGSKDKVKLTRTLGQSGIYVALSHCWGKKTFMTTTSKTLKRRKQGILLTNLPKTFRDAIGIARQFGVRYLWIDSLCIMQDAERDWHNESSKMGEVYKNATFTIAATAATDGTVGCFVARHASTIKPVQLPNFSGKSKHRAQVYIGLQHGSYFTNVSESPLQRRAWVIQELILSRRILHFGSQQTFFECQRACIAEDGTTHLLNGRLKQSFDLRDYEGAERGDVDVHEWISALPLHRRWSRIIEDYTRRALTKHTDKLPALAGLAAEVRKRSDDKYIAGLWLNGLYMSLLWTSCQEGALTEAPQYRAPSWSWASKDGPVEWTLDSAMRQQWTKSEMEIIEADITPELSQDAYGSVKDGFLRLKCRVKTVGQFSTKSADGIIPEGLLERSTTLMDKEGGQVGYGFLDSLQSLEDERPATPNENATTKFRKESPWLTCASIARCEYGSGTSSNRSLGVLLLEGVHDAPGTFRRIGAAQLFVTDFFDDQQDQAIKLI